jgi:hypothetical protein
MYKEGTTVQKWPRMFHVEHKSESHTQSSLFHVEHTKRTIRIAVHALIAAGRTVIDKECPLGAWFLGQKRNQSD